MLTNSFLLKLKAFQRALSQLEKALNEPFSEYVRDAAIQRFEFTYELAWNTLKVYLATLDLIVLNPKETLKMAYQQGLITNAKAWSELHVKRNLTLHTYDEQLAADIYSWLKKDGIVLFHALEKTLSQMTSCWMS